MDSQVLKSFDCDRNTLIISDAEEDEEGHPMI